ncbi:MAG TPA: phosphatase PAP2 family protein [Candidatus Polarisedimenticolaceae bacterium]|nr:phosphatase PAP2 family protein [Candidatus Polarisedimenticolaceae bacterium]
MHARGLVLAVLVATSAARAGDAPAPWAGTLFAREAEDQPAPKPEKKGCGCSDPETRARHFKCFFHLLGHDFVRVFTAPARWEKKDWWYAAAGVAGVGLLFVVDDNIRATVIHHDDRFQDDVASTVQPLGTWASFIVIGGFTFGGLAAHDDKAYGAGIDALSASAISGLVIVPVMKKVIGRFRPNAGYGPYHFEPFKHGPSFPSGHAAQAFTVASVIATEYPNRWVKFGCYFPASLVLFARVRHDAHWASDVVAGALIGYGTGREVARTNLAEREGRPKVRLVPTVTPRGPAIMLAVRL